MDIGTIKTITLEDGRLECVIDFGADDVDPLVVVYNGANRSEYPLPGDEVVVDRDGAESVIVAVFREHPDGVISGESIIYGRDGSGNMVSSVKLCSDGKVLINGGGDVEVNSNGKVLIGGGGDVEVSSDSDIKVSGSSVTIGESVVIGDGGDPVATSWVVNNYFKVSDVMFKALDALAGGIYASQLSAVFPTTGGAIPSSASKNLESTSTAIKVTP